MEDALGACRSKAKAEPGLNGWTPCGAYAVPDGKDTAEVRTIVARVVAVMDAMHARRDDDCREHPLKRGRQRQVHVGPHVEDWGKHPVGRCRPRRQAQDRQHDAAHGSVDQCLPGVVPQARRKVHLFVGVVDGMETPKRPKMLHTVEGVGKRIQQDQVHSQDQPGIAVAGQQRQRPTVPAIQHHADQAGWSKHRSTGKDRAKQAKVCHPAKPGGSGAISWAVRLENCQDNESR